MFNSGELPNNLICLILFHFRNFFGEYYFLIFFEIAFRKLRRTIPGCYVIALMNVYKGDQTSENCFKAQLHEPRYYFFHKQNFMLCKDYKKHLTKGNSD